MNFWSVMVQRFPYFISKLLSGAAMTVEVAAGALVFALIAGLLIALVRLSRMHALRIAAIAYIELIRGTPALAQLFIIYFGLPDLGITPAPITAAIIGLGLNGAAYLAEIYRAGIEAIHKGQVEAALSLGMTPATAMRWIILPQAGRIVLPPVANYAIGLLKDTAVCAIIAAPELMLRAKDIASSSFRPMHLFVLAAVLYFIMSYPLAVMARRLEARLARGR